MILEKNKFLLNSQTLFATTYPFFSIFGPFISELFLILAVLFFTIRVFLNSKYKYFKKYFIIIMFSSCIYFILISIFISKDPLLSFQSSLFFFRFGLFSLVIWNLLEENQNFIKYILSSLILILILLTIDSTFQYFSGYNFFGYEYDGIRIGSFLGNEYVLGSFLWKMEILLLVFYQMFFKDNKKFDFYIIALVILIDILILLSGERTSFFCLCFSSLLLIIFTKRIRKIKLYSSFVFFISAIVIIFTSPSIKSRLIDATVNEIGFKDNNIHIFTEIHEKHYISAYKMFNQNKIFGVGPKMFRIECNSEQYWVPSACATHPHNFYIQLLGETGLIGFLFLFIFLIYLSYAMIRYLIKNLKKNNIYDESYIGSIILLFTYIWPFMPHMNYFNNWINGLPFLSLGIFFYYYYKVKSK